MDRPILGVGLISKILIENGLNPIEKFLLFYYFPSLANINDIIMETWQVLNHSLMDI